MGFDLGVVRPTRQRYLSAIDVIAGCLLTPEYAIGNNSTTLPSHPLISPFYYTVIGP